MRRLLLLSALALGLAPAAAALTNPDHTVYCGIAAGKPAKLVCWRPRTGFTAQMTATAKPSSGFVRKNIGRKGSGKVLAYARTWTQGAWTCTSRKTGIICLNRKNHGWFFGPHKGYRTL
jgi:hypothetical protein